MYVCACKAVTDRTIRAAIAAGASTPEGIAQICGAGSRCGGCWPALIELLQEASPLGIGTVQRWGPPSTSMPRHP